MNTDLRLFSAALLVSGLGILGAAEAQQTSESSSDHMIAVEDVQTEISEALDAIGEYSQQERDAAIKTVYDNLERIDAEIDRLEHSARENWADMSQAARDRTSETLRKLHERRNRLSEMYGAMAEGTEAAWGKVVTGVKEAWNELEMAWDAAVTEANMNASN